VKKPRVDGELIERCIKGDQAAWKELVMRYERLVYSVANSICPPGEDIADVFQQVWVEVHESLPKLRSVESLPAWLTTVTRRRMYALLQRRRESQPIRDNMWELSAELGQIEHEHIVERALDQLPEPCRKLINLLYSDSKRLNYSDISKVMGIPEAKIGPTRARCLKKLRKLIG
jgi:RNA polymerase sigma factor (sigma-70 family)